MDEGQNSGIVHKWRSESVDGQHRGAGNQEAWYTEMTVSTEEVTGLEIYRL